ncbi:hypothetical protein Hanom_Chr02g00105711 [Helianthus anomalus]
MYMMYKVLENLIGKSVEQRFEEIELEEVRARRKAEIEAEMKNKGKSIQIESVDEVSERAIVVSEPTEDPETSILDPYPISSVSGMFDDDVEIDDVEDDDEEVDDVDDDDEEVDDVEDDDEEVDDIDECLHDDANEEPENAEGEGEHDDTMNVDDSDDHVTRLILCLEHGVEEGEILHTYTLAEIIKMTHVDENEFKFDFEEELNKFDVNQQPEYQYKYVEDASENVHVDTSNFPTLAEFFSQANEDELRRKFAESVKNESFNEMSKEEQREERENSKDR